MVEWGEGEEGEEEIEEIGEGKTRKFSRVAIIIALVGLLMFFVIIIAVFGIFESAVPGISQTCDYEISKEAMVSPTEPVTLPSQGDAQANLSALLAQEGNANVSLKFENRIIEKCGFGWVFNYTEDVSNETHKYVVCGTGQIYAYEKKCSGASFIEKIFGLFGTIRGIFKG